MSREVIVLILGLCVLLVSSNLVEKSVYLPQQNVALLNSAKNVDLSNFKKDISALKFAKRQFVPSRRTFRKKLKTNRNERQSDGPPVPAPPPSPPSTPTDVPTTPTQTPTPTPCYACILIPIVAVAIAVSVSVPLSANPSQVLSNFNPNSVAGNVSPQTIPQNLMISNTIGSLPDDGCGKGSVQFTNQSIQFNNQSIQLNNQSVQLKNQSVQLNNQSAQFNNQSAQFNNQTDCFPLLRPCQNPLFWTTVDPITKRGRCSPRLCGRERVFIGRTQLCHDIEDPSECTGGRRLYYTAYGDPICDCPIGSYPFPSETDDCVPLFTQGPCPAGQVFGVMENGFGCVPAECQPSQATDSLQQLIPGGDGFCYPLGSTGPCSGSTELLGFNVFERKAECVDINNPQSPYFESPQLKNTLDKTYNQRSPEFYDFEITLFSHNLLNSSNPSTRRQGLSTLGIFQLPTSTPSALLNPCRPGPNRGNNYKCSNPLIPNLRRRELLQAVRSAFTCRGNAALQARGTCGGSIEASSCGPSYEFSSATNRCEKSVP